MAYIYEGALSPHTMDSVRNMMRSYPNPVEFASIPAREVLDRLPEHKSMGEDCMGRDYAKTSRMFGIVHKNFSDPAAGVFVFFLTETERKIALAACPELVVNADPFRSVI